MLVEKLLFGDDKPVLFNVFVGERLVVYQVFLRTKYSE